MINNLFEKINNYKSRNVYNDVEQFEVLKSYDFYNNLFIETNENIDIYRETLIRRIRTREDWEKQPKQIIEDLTNSKALINKFLNQLVEDKEKETSEKIMRIKGINRRVNVDYLAFKLFDKILKERKYIKTLVSLIQYIQNDFKRVHKVFFFNSLIKKQINNFITSEMQSEELKTDLMESFGLFLKLIISFNFELPIDKMIKNYNLNVFIVFCQLLINQEEKVIEIIKMTDKTEEIKKKVNVVNHTLLLKYKNNVKMMIKTIENNKMYYIGKSKFLYMEVKDLYADYF